jgi:hypothetical protein
MAWPKHSHCHVIPPPFCHRLWPNGGYERDYWQPPCHELTLNDLFRVEEVQRWNSSLEERLDMYSPRYLYFDIPQRQAAAEEEVAPVSALVGGPLLPGRVCCACCMLCMPCMLCMLCVLCAVL